MKSTKSFLKLIAIILVSIIILTATVVIWISIRNYDRYGIRFFLPASDEKNVYINNGFGDSAEYIEYHYNDKTINKMLSNIFLEEVTEDNMEIILSYFKNYEARIESLDFKHQYSFDISQIKCGDYCFIYTLEGKPIGQSIYERYDDYDVYYVDMEKCIMYYIHSNI